MATGQVAAVWPVPLTTTYARVARAVGPTALEDVVAPLAVACAGCIGAVAPRVEVLGATILVVTLLPGDHDPAPGLGGAGDHGPTRGLGAPWQPQAKRVSPRVWGYLPAQNRL